LFKTGPLPAPYCKPQLLSRSERILLLKCQGGGEEDDISIYSTNLIDEIC